MKSAQRCRVSGQLPRPKLDIDTWFRSAGGVLVFKATDPATGLVETVELRKSDTSNFRTGVEVRASEWADATFVFWCMRQAVKHFSISD